MLKHTVLTLTYIKTCLWTCFHISWKIFWLCKGIFFFFHLSGEKKYTKINLFTEVHCLIFCVFCVCEFWGFFKGKKHSRWRGSHQQSLECFKVHYIHGKRSCLDMKLSPAVCKFFPSAGVLQSKEPGVSRALSPPTGAASQTNSSPALRKSFKQNMQNVFSCITFWRNSTWFYATYISKQNTTQHFTFTAVLCITFW